MDLRILKCVLLTWIFGVLITTAMTSPSVTCLPGTNSTTTETVICETPRLPDEKGSEEPRPLVGSTASIILFTVLGVIMCVILLICIRWFWTSKISRKGEDISQDVYTNGSRGDIIDGRMHHVYSLNVEITDELPRISKPALPDTSHTAT